MKTLLILVILMVLAGQFAFSQNAFYDAQYLGTLTAKERTLLITAIAPAQASQFSQEEDSTLINIKQFFTNPFDKTINRKFLNSTVIKKIIVKMNILTQPANVASGISMPDAFSDLGGGDLTTTSLTGSSNSLGQFNSGNIQTMLIDATAKYLAKSFKEDMTYQYFVVLKQKINESLVCKDLLPQTSAAIVKIDPFNFKNLGTSWKAAFETDMQNLPVSFTTFIKDNPNVPWCTKIAQSDYFRYYNYSVDLLNPLIKGQTPVQILETLDKNYYTVPLTDPKDSYKSFIHFINILQSNLQDSTKTSDIKQYNQWISFAQLKQLNTVMKQKYFCALLYLDDHEFFDTDHVGAEIDKILNASADSTKCRSKLINSLPNWLTLLEQVEGGLKEIRTAKTNGTNTSATIGIYMKNVLAIADSTNSILKKFATTGTTLDKITTTLNDCINYGNDADSLYVDITAKNYEGAITQVVSLLEKIDKNDKTTLQLIQNVITVTYQGDFIKIYSGLPVIQGITITADESKTILYNNIKFNIIDAAGFENDFRIKVGYSGLTPAIKSSIDNALVLARTNINILNKDLLNNADIKNLASYTKILELLNRYGSVIAGVATAENSDDLENVIEKFIATSGTYVTQRTSISTISLAAKVGFYGGFEGTDKLKSFSPNIGLTVPIGIEFSWGHRTDKKTDYSYLTDDNKIQYLTGASRSLFVQFFDIGAVVNYRLGADSTSALPQNYYYNRFFPRDLPTISD